MSRRDSNYDSDSEQSVDLSFMEEGQETPELAVVPAHHYRPLSDAARMYFEIQTLASKWVIQLLSSLDKSGYEVSYADRVKLVSPVVTAISALLTIAATGYNVRHKHGELPPAAEAFIMSGLGSSMLYIAYDFISSGKTLDEDLPEFIIASVLIPFVTAYLAHGTIPDKAWESVSHIDFSSLTERFAEQGSSVGENIYNAIKAGLEYGLSGLLALWVVNRESYGVTTETANYQLAIAAMIMLGCGVSGYMARRAPEPLAYTAAAAASLKTATFTYASMSGLVAMLLSAFNVDEEDTTPAIRAAFVAICLVPALLLGYEKSQTTQVRFDAWHNAYLSTVGTLETAGDGVQYVFGGQALKDFVAWCRGTETHDHGETVPLLPTGNGSDAVSAAHLAGGGTFSRPEQGVTDAEGDTFYESLESQSPELGSSNV